MHSILTVHLRFYIEATTVCDGKKKWTLPNTVDELLVSKYLLKNKLISSQAALGLQCILPSGHI